VAQALHASSRRKGRYVVTNVAALGDGLIESELFGHVRGAFTSSAGARHGLVQHADHGTLFLDEIHRLSPTAQPKLLRVLETQLVRPVGSDHEVRSDVRVVSAANEDLETMVDAGRFQGDLLARLARLVIHVPPLVDHVEDVPLLAERFVNGLEGFSGARLTPAALDALKDYDWPRNVRELQIVVERAAILCDRPWIDRMDVVAAIQVGRPECAGPRVRDARPLSAKAGQDLTARRERRLIDALQASGGRVRLAATALGVSRNTVYRWMGELGIAPQERRSARPHGRQPSMANDQVPGSSA
jgi:DNA-binding NtrC family response regulator